MRRADTRPVTALVAANQSRSIRRSGTPGPPHLDEQAVTSISQPGQHDLVELGPEQLTGRLPLQVADEGGPTSHLRFSRSFGRMTGRPAASAKPRTVSAIRAVVHLA